MSFALDPRLEADTFWLGDFALSRVLLMNDARYEWLILVPRRQNLVEIVDLGAAERATLIEEIAVLAEFLRAREKTEKINVGALGNIVRQLHVHVVARRPGDAAWPGPVWGADAAVAYETGAAATKIAKFRAALGFA